MQERYFLAARAGTLLRPGPAAFVAAMHGPAARKILKGLPGYAAPRSHETVSPRDVLG